MKMTAGIHTCALEMCQFSGNVMQNLVLSDTFLGYGEINHGYA